MMNAQRLDLLVRVADARTDSAERELGRLQATLRDQATRLDELRRYQHEYRIRPMPETPTLMANRERFLARLSEAENQQQNAVVQAEAAVRAGMKAWTEQRRNVKRFETLQDGVERQVARKQEARAQAGLDDFAMRGFVALRAALAE